MFLFRESLHNLLSIFVLSIFFHFSQSETLSTEIGESNLSNFSCSNLTNTNNGEIECKSEFNISQNDLNNYTQQLMKKEMCVKSIKDDQLTLKNCLTKEKVTFRKCCPLNQRLSPIPISKNVTNETRKGYDTFQCVNDTPWNPAIFQKVDSGFGDHVDLKNFSRPYKVSIGFPNCTNNGTELKRLNNHQDIWFKVLESGEVFIGLKFWFRPVWLPVSIDSGSESFCLDEVEGIDNTNDTNSSHEMFHKNQILIYCGIERFDTYLFHRILFGSLCVFASFIILILLVIYISIWDKQNLAGWTQFNIFVALFFVFGFEGVRTLLDYNGLHVNASTSCLVIAAIAQYFFFALNTTWCVMNFDLFWTFWKLDSNLKGTRGREKRIMAYLFFSWGLPLLVIVFAFCFKHIEANGSKETMTGIYSEAHRRCSSPIREFGFQTQGVMFLCNLVFFGFTGFLIWKHRRGISNHHRRTNRSERHNWRSVILFAKLLIVMGVSSLSIPLDYFFGSDDPLSATEVIFRTVHFIPVVSVLFIFGFNEKNLHLMKQKYPNIATMIPMMNLKPSGTDTNQSPSGAQNSTEIK